MRMMTEGLVFTALLVAAGTTGCGEDCPPGQVAVGGRCVRDEMAAASGGTAEERDAATATGGTARTGGSVEPGGKDASDGSMGCEATTEVCDGEDNDCDGKADNGQDLCATGETCHEGECVACITDGDCADNASACKVGACNAGTCGFQQAPTGSECGAGSVCTPTGSCADCYGSGLAGAVGCDTGEGCYGGRCSQPACGNGIIEAPDEECDPAITNDYHCDPTTCQLTGATVTAFQPCQSDNDCNKCTAVRPDFPPTTEGFQESQKWTEENCGGKENCSSGICRLYSKPVDNGACSWADSPHYTHTKVAASCVLDCSAPDALCPRLLPDCVAFVGSNEMLLYWCGNAP